MKPNKFSSSKKEVRSSELQSKMERIALAIADQLIDGKQELRGAVDLEESQAVLKTLTSYFATVNRVDMPAQVGGAFDAYRQKIESSRGAGDSGDDNASSPAANVVKLGNLANRASAIPADDGDEGSESEEAE